MSIVRRRYYFWLARAYVARWYKTIISSLILGVAIFFGIIFLLDIYLLPILQKKVLKIGYVGIYNLATVPSEVLSDVSYGLTQVNTNGTISPAAAYKWDITDNGRDYTFYLRRGQFFHNGQELTSYNLPISFQDVNKKVVDKYTVSFILHSPYAPFLASVSKPLLLNDLAGLGKYKISKVDINGGFVRSMTFQDLSDVGKRKIISFYPSEVALKDAYALGNVDEARGIADLVVRG
ncbi:MAG TPA: ABC transporter substrate-binding protein, partial [Patescibacteria group bacterium]|nr:ABC transporter substrate-binding protein [Patescibacteria group bacterium]